MSKPTGWFSRRYPSNEAHEQARSVKQAKLSGHFATRERCAIDRASRTNAEQIACIPRQHAGQGPGRC